jgi:hypothetical protein
MTFSAMEKIMPDRSAVRVISRRPAKAALTKTYATKAPPQFERSLVASLRRSGGGCSPLPSPCSPLSQPSLKRRPAFAASSPRLTTAASQSSSGTGARSH